jgi:hypothetical protein
LTAWKTGLLAEDAKKRHKIKQRCDQDNDCDFDQTNEMQPYLLWSSAMLLADGDGSPLHGFAGMLPGAILQPFDHYVMLLRSGRDGRRTPWACDRVAVMI